MRDFLFGAVTFFFIGLCAGVVMLEHTRKDADVLLHAEWQCTDVRIDGLSLPLVPVCWEYTRKAAK